MRMYSTGRIVFLFVLVATLQGCASYKLGRLETRAPVGVEEEKCVVAGVGSNVKINTRTGEEFVGRILLVTDDFLTLGDRENYGGGDVEIPLDEIIDIYVRTQSDGKIESTWLVGVGVAIAAGTVYLLSNYGWN